MNPRTKPSRRDLVLAEQLSALSPERFARILAHTDTIRAVSAGARSKVWRLTQSDAAMLAHLWFDPSKLSESEIPAATIVMLTALLRSTEEVSQHIQTLSRQNEKLLKENAELTKETMRDRLTGALNRTGLQEHMVQSLSSLLRHGGSLTIAYVDLDHFKPLNDTHGHAVWDAALKMVTTGLQRHMRWEDTIGRLGGDEFQIFSYQPKELSLEDMYAFWQHIQTAMRGGTVTDALRASRWQPSASIGIMSINQGWVKKHLGAMRTENEVPKGQRVKPGELVEIGRIITSITDRVMYTAKESKRGSISLLDRENHAAHVYNSRGKKAHSRPVVVDIHRAIAKDVAGYTAAH